MSVLLGLVQVDFWQVFHSSARQLISQSSCCWPTLSDKTSCRKEQRWKLTTSTLSEWVFSLPITCIDCDCSLCDFCYCCLCCLCCRCSFVVDPSGSDELNSAAHSTALLTCRLLTCSRASISTQLSLMCRAARCPIAHLNAHFSPAAD